MLASAGHLISSQERAAEAQSGIGSDGATRHRQHGSCGRMGEPTTWGRWSNIDWPHVGIIAFVRWNMELACWQKEMDMKGGR